eukprot:TRINITY_DN13410_c0_g1_i1.p1 TRINITY_DN13410_c0_g1~~TRINITY_DN13410_c0_g1_i1.p1  ORF type:complete len:309 (-),score=21.07 TRINITY_DN13410_c0_g1_i1:97-1023(-)
MADRFEEFRSGVTNLPQDDDDVEMQPLENGTSGNGSMDQFFSDVELVKKNITAIKTASKSVTDINQKVALATTAEKESSLSEALKPVIKDANKKAQVSKQILQHLREDTDTMKTSNDSNVKQADIRIRENLVNTLTRKFVDVMKEYQNAQQKYKQDIKKKVTRQVQIVKPDATTEEVDAVFKSGGGTNDFFKNAILKGDAADSITNAYMNAKDKYQDVLTLEASVQELHQMFLDFALLTEQQGEMLDQIEFQIKSASDYIDEGNTNMVQAVELQKSLRYKQCCCCILVIVIIGVIVAIIYVMTEGKNK